MEQEKFKQLMDAYVTGRLSGDQGREFLSMLEQDTYRQILETELEETFMKDAYVGDEPVERRDRLNKMIHEKIGVPRRQPVFRRIIGYAAAAMLAGAAAVYFLQQPEKEPTNIAQYDIAPGSNKAILTLSDGTAIPLDSTGTKIISQGITRHGSRLQYDNTASVSMNTLTTPRGGEFQLKLPDGTRVWLNAASSIKYPTAFRSKERVVEITGEVYFEVAANANQPFIVKTDKDTKVEVLGTSFNVNAYTDEAAIRTTLLEGAVRVNGITLRPGEQLAGKTVIKHADVNKTLAWKNGYFNFEDIGLEEAMRQLARWYDIEVVYENGVPDVNFFGKMGRDLSLSEMLRLLKVSNIRFRQENRRLIVLN